MACWLGGWLCGWVAVWLGGCVAGWLCRGWLAELADAVAGTSYVAG